MTLNRNKIRVMAFTGNNNFFMYLPDMGPFYDPYEHYQRP